MRIGIFFGGPSREREISFAGGRTVFDNLDKTLFEAVPIFVDSHKNWILLDWQLLYKGSIRDFYPPVDFHPQDDPHHFQLYIESLGELSAKRQAEIIAAVGQSISPNELAEHIDFAFLALHGEYGEDGQLQGLLDSLSIPYSGSGIRACSIGIDKAFQKRIMEAAGFNSPAMQILRRKDWPQMRQADDLLQAAFEQLGTPLVVRPARQGSSIGVQIVQQANSQVLRSAIDGAFFMLEIQSSDWQHKSTAEKSAFIRELADIRTGIGLPLRVVGTEQRVESPWALWKSLDEWTNEQPKLLLEAEQTEQDVVLEGFLRGKEFSCVVIEDEDGSPIALPPTEIRKGEELFDYRSKYLAGLSRKVTPIELPDAQIEAIRAECERLYQYLDFGVYARIDGFIREDGQLFLNDPNTTSGMLPSSFFFHQAAEIGWNPSQFLTYIIRTSLKVRQRERIALHAYSEIVENLDKALAAKQQEIEQRECVGVLLGGYSSERHISVESGRNIFEKLASSKRYLPIPIFLTLVENKHALFELPIHILLKDNADDIRDKVLNYQQHPIVERIKKRCADLVQRYTTTLPLWEPRQLSYAGLAKEVDACFIALHGRPGEDGEVQQRLAALGIPYNGSEQKSAQLTIDKYRTLQRLRQAGFEVTGQKLLSKQDFKQDARRLLNRAEIELGYPLIAKPVDDGCSSAVKLIRNRAQLEAFLEALFRNEIAVAAEAAEQLKLKPKEEFPQKEWALLEQLITKGDALHFLEITGGLLTHYEGKELMYEVFEPSEALAGAEVLSLEEKFLAGEGQNLTPARFVPPGAAFSHEFISEQVRADLEKAARVLGVSGYARIDAFVRIYKDGRAETLIIEVNALPGMTPATCIFHQSALNGYTPYAFIEQILDFGKQRFERGN